MNLNACALCGDPSAKVADAAGFLFVECVRCGKYEVSFVFAIPALQQPEWRDKNRRLLAAVSAHTRQASERGSTARVEVDNYKDLARRHLHTSVATKLTRLLEYFAERGQTPGQGVSIVPNDEWPLFDAANGEELHFLINALSRRGDVRQVGFDYVVTVDGWARLYPLNPGGEPGTCFVAMAFDRSLDPAYDNGIALAIRDCDLREVRVDRVEHNGIVTDLILGSIQTSQVTIADVTLQRNGVYFEAGFALGLGRTVIWSCREDDLRNVHFDTRQYGHVVWEKPSDLREKLRNRIRSTVPFVARKTT